MAEPRKRAWTVPDDLPEHDGIYPIDRNHAAEAFVEAETILARLGGVMMIAPVRTEVGPGRWVTRGYTFRHESFAPAERRHTEANERIEDQARRVLDEPEPVEAA
jgi:hypothetical protein